MRIGGVGVDVLAQLRRVRMTVDDDTLDGQLPREVAPAAEPVNLLSAKQAAYVVGPTMLAAMAAPMPSAETLASLQRTARLA